MWFHFIHNITEIFKIGFRYGGCTLTVTTEYLGLEIRQLSSLYQSVSLDDILVVRMVVGHLVQE